MRERAWRVKAAEPGGQESQPASRTLLLPDEARSANGREDHAATAIKAQGRRESPALLKHGGVLFG